jgi:hypothetical protein
MASAIYEGGAAAVWCHSEGEGPVVVDLVADGVD